MVFSINPTAAKTHAQFQALAIQQAGSGTGSAITGNAPAGGEAGGAGAGAGAGAAASPSLATPPGATGAAGAGAAASTGVATGTGQIAADGSCLCAVQCSFGGFPNQAVQGRDSFGGFVGKLLSI